MQYPSTSKSSVFFHWKSTGTIEVPVFYPTLTEMADFPGYIRKIEEEHQAHLVCGIAKVSFIVATVLFDTVYFAAASSSCKRLRWAVLVPGCKP